MGGCKVSGANASPLAGHAVALKAQLNLRDELWQGLCWLHGGCWTGALALLGERRGTMEGIHQVQFTERQGTCAALHRLGAGSVNPVAHSVLPMSQLGAVFH